MYHSSTMDGFSQQAYWSQYESNFDISSWANESNDSKMAETQSEPKQTQHDHKEIHITHTPQPCFLRLSSESSLASRWLIRISCLGARCPFVLEKSNSFLNMDNTHKVVFLLFWATAVGKHQWTHWRCQESMAGMREAHAGIITSHWALCAMGRSVGCPVSNHKHVNIKWFRDVDRLGSDLLCS